MTKQDMTLYVNNVEVRPHGLQYIELAIEGVSLEEMMDHFSAKDVLGELDIDDIKQYVKEFGEDD